MLSPTRSPGPSVSAYGSRVRPVLALASLMGLCLVACTTTANVPGPSAADTAPAAPDGPEAQAPGEPGTPMTPATPDEPDQASEVANADQATACSTTADCPADHVCEGQGCGELEGRCQPNARMCTRDLREYCGCDGETFRSSGSCPGKRYSRTGPCEQAG